MALLEYLWFLLQIAIKKYAWCIIPLPKQKYFPYVFCKSAYGLQCANIGSKRYYAFYASEKQRIDNWQCPGCQSQMPKTGNANTPARSTDQDGGERLTSPIESPTKSQDRNVTKRVKPASLLLRRRILLLI